MVPKVQGAEDIHYVDRLLAQLEAAAGLTRPILVHAILETARGVANVEEICGASPRMQGLSLGPADLAADRRMKTTRVGGGHPGYLVRQDPPTSDGVANIEATRATYQQDLWHYTIARMVDACAMHGIYPYYGPFGDIADVVACEDQFRNAFLLGCVGTWSLHPKQIAIANRVFSPSVEDVAHARRVVAAMGDGTGAVMLDGKMEDDASLKQCLVMVELAEQLAAIDPELKKRYDEIERRLMSDFTPLRSVLYMPSSNEQGAREGQDARRSTGVIFDLEDAVAPDAKPAAREAACAAAASGDYGRRTLTIRVNGIGTEWHDADLAAAAQAGPDAVVVPKVNSADEVGRLVDALEKAGAPDHTMLWAMIETPVAILDVLSIARASERLTCLVMGTNDLVKELYAEHVPGPRADPAEPAHRPARRPRGRHRDPRRRLQRREGHRRLPRRVRAGPADGLRRQDPHPPRPGRRRQRRVRPVRAGRRGRPRPDRGLRGRPARSGEAPASSPTTAGWSRRCTSSPPGAP